MTRSEDGTDWYRWRRPSRKRGPIRRRIVDNGNSVDRPHFRRSIHQWDTEIDCIPPSCLEKENKFNPIIILVCVCVCVCVCSQWLRKVIICIYIFREFI